MKEFTDLEVWKEAHKLTLLVYKATKAFPKEELFSLTNQIQRAVVSIESNVAEGYGRYTLTEQHHFCNIAKGSLAELQCQLMIARDLGYLSADAYAPLYAQSISVRRLLLAYMRALREP